MTGPSSTARLTEQACVLLAKDVAASAAYWIEKVGFGLVGEWGDPPDFAILGRDGRYVMIGAAPADHVIVPYWKTRPNLWNAYFWVDDVEALFAELKARGARIDYDLCTQPYHVREFGIQDPDGHDVGFGQVLKPAAAS
jgi:catechol 2,3-dioxygenase-like lactoylglutathione lyase family enzyme